MSDDTGGVPRLVATLRFPHLGLQLDGGLRTGFRRYLSDGVDLDESGWAKESYVCGRDPAQTAHVVNALAEACAPAEETPRLDDLSDESITLSIESRGGAASLAAFGTAARRVLEAARQLRFSVPPPKEFAEDLERWRKLARALGSKLHTSHMGADGKRAGTPASVRTRWSAKGEAMDAEVTLEPRATIDERRSFSWSPDASADSIPEGVGPAAHAMLTALGAHALSVTVEPQELTAYVPPNDPEAALEVADMLLVLATHLRGGGGPFR